MAIDELFVRANKVDIQYDRREERTVFHIVGPDFEESPGGSPTNHGWEMWVAGEDEIQGEE